MNYKEYLQSADWLAKRDAALNRAGHRCQVCNGADDLNVHHRTYENIFNERPPDLTVLCQTCHSLFHERMTDEPSDDYTSPINDWMIEQGLARAGRSRKRGAE